jgi:predicted permease
MVRTQTACAGVKRLLFPAILFPAFKLFSILLLPIKALIIQEVVDKYY